LRVLYYKPRMVRVSKTPPATANTAPKAKTTKKTKVDAAPLVNEIVAAPPAEVAATEPVVETPIIMTKMTEFSAKLQQLVGLFSTMKSDFKTLEKAMNREMKIAAKAASKKRRNSGNRKPSGFVKPTRISDELANFLGKEIGTEMARTDVSKEINAYIQAHSLQDKKNGRIIHPDGKLTKLLKVAKEDELTYFNLQRYMKHHFQKASDLIAAATV
jgi:chromatin remodeling complex protein RSC6